MAFNPFYADNTVITGLNAMAALFNSGKLEIYSGTQPTDANTALGAQVLLSTMTLNATAFPTAVASGSAPTKVCTLTANSITSDTNAAATGTASWFRIYKSDGTTKVMDGSVNSSGSYDMILNTTSIVAGATVSCTSFTITQAE